MSFTLGGLTMPGILLAIMFILLGPNHVTVHGADHEVALLGLDDLVETLEVSVMIGILPPGWWGAYHAFSRTVTMREGLSAPQFRSVLAHELGHAHHGHGFSECRSVQERMADRFAAQHLIRFDAYREAVRKHGTDTAAIAAELHVMEWVVTEYAETMNGSMFSRVGLDVCRPQLVIPHETEAVCEGIMDIESPVDSKVLILGNNVLR